MKFTTYASRGLLAAALVSLGACDQGFEELNIDPNKPSEVPTSYLFTQGERALVTQVFDPLTVAEYAIHYPQYFSQTQYADITRYSTVESSFYPFYTGGLADMQEIIRLNTTEETMDAAAASGANVNQVAVARILKVWGFHNVTDMWGDIPYSQALLGREAFSPVYDPQSEIYPALIQELTEAAAQIDENQPGVVGDIIYGGDMAMWKLFANSLKLRLGMRMSEVAPDMAKTAVTEALSAGVFTSNDDNAMYTYLSAQPNVNPYYNHFLTRTDFAVTNTMVDMLKAMDDPRLAIYADPIGVDVPRDANEFPVANPEYVGMIYGETDAVSGSIRNQEVSFPGLATRAATAKSPILVYSEVLFNQAEAAARGWTGGDAEALYEAAIRASMEQWNTLAAEVGSPYQVTAAEIDAYIASGDVAYDAANFEKSIGTQKWLALYMQGFEGWSEWRRLDYPDLKPAPAAPAGMGIPRRRGYTETENSLNKANYDAAIARMGGNGLSTRMWWDVE
ncbi:Starch-binding associating with outer membrane [Catalinimonas alkaloidigena]|uniref:Starch-binding associating with outer membrane n=1 Tax=Catalinimonas alkaloidigena TaxID=1075417 RepID=A0A1G9GYE3_9BACT|nr:SusD/RagB family nutrient-binding outer membrane lipoprotein [Catalinimonas alkaloidigena]SDL05293.1 Starch-binding associating with outer membrane [Catalinimonas alkaloidigena]